MKRKLVALYVKQTGFCKAEVNKVEARCCFCEYWDKYSDDPISDGNCVRYPTVCDKYRDDWCGEFKPEWDLCKSVD